MKRFMGWSGRFLGLALVLLGGISAAGASGKTRPNRFVLFLYEGNGFQDSGSHAAEYRAWAAKLRGAGVEVSGEELSGDESAVLEGGGVRSGRKNAEGVAGYFIVSARDLPSAVALAKGCPHLRHGGRIVIQALVP